MLNEKIYALLGGTYIFREHDATQPSPYQMPVAGQLQLQTQMQSQNRYPQQLQNATQPSPYQNAGVAGHQNIQGFGYSQMPVAGGSMNDSARFQQGMQQGAQDWMWKNKTAGPGS